VASRSSEVNFTKNYALLYLYLYASSQMISWIRCNKMFEVHSTTERLPA